MNDTHGVKGEGWIGFDLDGTLAVYNKWEGIDRIGEPVKPMVDLMKKLHGEGKVVKILTARVAPRANTEYKPNPYYREHSDPILKNDHLFTRDEFKMLYGLKTWDARGFVIDWCRENLGFLPEITHEKDHLMVCLYDDRVKQVLPNKGLLVEDMAREANASAHKLYGECGWLLAQVESKRNGFWAGFWLATMIFMLVNAGVQVYDRFFKEEKTDTQTRVEKAHEVLCDLIHNWPAEWKTEERK